MISFNSHNWWIAPLVLALVIYRVRRSSRERALKIERLWVIPALLLIAGALTIWQTPIAGLGWLWLIPTLLAGAALGYWRGRFTVVTIDPQTHDLTSRTSAAGVYLVVAVLAIRIALRFLVFAVGLIAAQRLEIWIRARKLLARARSTIAPA
jgi:hypothetical protein